MQPYLFPYLDYYQLVSAVDTFVFFDDVNYINNGWINRHQLLQQNQPLKFTTPLLIVSHNIMINEIELAYFTKWRKDFLKSIKISYKKASHFTFVFNWLTEVLFLKNYSLISDLAAESVKVVARRLELSTQFKNSSSLNYKSNDILDGP